MPEGFQEVEFHRFQDSENMKFFTTAFTLREIFMVLLQSESTPVSWRDQKNYVNEKCQWLHQESDSQLFDL
jgi:hypothetical protein